MSEDKPSYIPIHRKFFDHEFWAEKREFSKAEAWIDLIQSARYKKEENVEFIDNKRITWGYGQLPASVRFLKKRWGWKSNGRVERFLEILKKCNMIEIETGQGQSIITLCNYDKYDIRNIPDGTATGRKRDADGTATGRNSNKGNKGKKVNNKPPFIPPTLVEVSAYMQEQYQNTSDAERFVDFYESKGWYVGKNKMKDWKAAIRNWMRGKNDKKNTNGKQNYGHESRLDSFERRASEVLGDD